MCVVVVIETGSSKLLLAFGNFKLSNPSLNHPPILHSEVWINMNKIQVWNLMCRTVNGNVRENVNTVSAFVF